MSACSSLRACGLPAQADRHSSAIGTAHPQLGGWAGWGPWQLVYRPLQTLSWQHLRPRRSCLAHGMLSGVRGGGSICVLQAAGPGCPMRGPEQGGLFLLACLRLMPLSDWHTPARRAGMPVLLQVRLLGACRGLVHRGQGGHLAR